LILLYSSDQNFDSIKDIKAPNINYVNAKMKI
jgi:hypothetical protein